MDSARIAGPRNTGLILRIVLAANFVLFILSFIPAVSGIGPKPGLFDRLWGNYRLAGWRVDVLWMCVSTVFIFGGGIRWIAKRGLTNPTAILCLVWLVCFLFYAGHIVVHMFG